MSGDLFGAPRGFIAAEEQANRTGLVQVQAQKLLGDISMQPSELALRTAQTRNINAEAGIHEATLADQQYMAKLEAASRQATAEVAANEGRTANVQDVQNILNPTSVMAPLVNQYNYAVKAGAPMRLLAPMADRIAKNMEHIGVAGYRTAQMEEVQRKNQAAAADQIGSYAQAALQSPENYAQIKLLATQQGQNLPPQVKKYIDGLPQSWQEAQPSLQALVSSSLKVKDSITIAQKQQEIDQRKSLDASTKARNYASAAAAGVRSGLVKEQTDILKKLGGEGTPAAQAAQESSAALNDEKIKKERIAQHSLLPADRNALRGDRTYSLTDGSVVRPIIGPNGKATGFEEVMPALPQRAPPRTADQIRKDQLNRAKAGGTPVSAIAGDDDEGDA